MAYKIKKSNVSEKDFCETTFLVSVLDSIHEAVVVINAMGFVIYANPAYSRTLGVELGKIVNHNLRDVAPEAKALETLDSGIPIIEQPSRVLGLGIDVIVSCTPVYDQNNIIAGVVAIFKNVSEVKKLSETLERMINYTSYLENQVDKRNPMEFRDVIGNNNKFRDTLALAIKAANSDVTVLVSGETGTGKEIFANIIHRASKRKNNSFIKINCAAIPENLLESELFGYDEGAFSGARKGGKPGKFELADKGTIFLDEIGDMGLMLQAKLLRVLQENEIYRVGGTKKIPIDVRIIAATNQDLEKKVQEKSFREDIFYRLNVFRVHVPPLRERKDDIPLLINYFLNKITCREKKEASFSQQALNILCKYDWPGNVRELQNIVEYAVVSSEGRIEIKHLPEHLTKLFPLNPEEIRSLNGEVDLDLERLIEQLEKDTISRALDKTSNNKSKAIDMLGISRSAFYEKVKRYGLM